jgi:Cu-Zn family superoxide dismutase
MRKNSVPRVVLAAAIGLAGPASAGEKATKAVAELRPTSGQKAAGTVTFLVSRDGTRVVADLVGLSPGPHGFHVHETGDCSAPDASSAGGHFNPTGEPHAAPDAARRHAGDLGNLVAGYSGAARLERVDERLVLEGPDSIVGRAVIVHEKADDLRTQPTGDAGGRLACGVIRLEK